MKIKKSELEQLYMTKSVQEVMDFLGLKSHGALYRLLEKSGIERKRPDNGPRIRTNVEVID